MLRVFTQLETQSTPRVQRLIWVLWMGKASSLAIQLRVGKQGSATADMKGSDQPSSVMPLSPFSADMSLPEAGSCYSVRVTYMKLADSYSARHQRRTSSLIASPTNLALFHPPPRRET
jgi:hypothetical protein